MEPIKVRGSDIMDYMVCPRLSYYRRVMGLQPKVDDPKLIFGTGIHCSLEEYYKTGDKDKALVAYRDWLIKEAARLNDLGADPNIMEQSASIGEALLIEYINYAKEHDAFIVEHTEQKFQLPLWDNDGEQMTVNCSGCNGFGFIEGENIEDCLHCKGVGKIPVVHEGKMDGIVVDRLGKRWLMEHKTAAQFPSDLELQLNTQVNLYMLACTQLFDDMAGVVYNIIKKVHPKKARSPVIARKFVNRTPTEILNAQKVLARTVKKMLILDGDFDPNPGMHCTWRCPYVQLCLADNDGTSKEDIIKYMYTTREERAQSELSNTDNHSDESI